MDWLNVFLFTLLILGHTKLWVTFVNRTHGLPWDRRKLRRLRHLHDVMIFAGPAAAIWFVGLRGPRLLLADSDWSQLPPAWGVAFGICAAGFVWLVWVSIRGALITNPPQLLSNHSQHVDIARELGRVPRARGHHSLLARVPFNEQFRLEYNEKILLSPTLPAAWEGLTILHLSDWHFQGTITRDYFERVTEIVARDPVDLAIFTGDLMDDLAYLDWISATLGKLHGQLGRGFILGNHDWYHGEAAIRRAVADLGWRDIRREPWRLERDGSLLEFTGDETPWMGEHPPISSDVDYRILLSHTPDNLAWAKSQNVDLMLSGHNHGGQIRLPVIGPVYSPSKYGCKYSAGTFWEEPTLLHVSRGLSGEHPLRWRCLPEVSRLVLLSKVDNATESVAQSIDLK